jgi:RNA polymerase sigma-70 factor (ECF subfamily)
MLNPDRTGSIGLTQELSQPSEDAKLASFFASQEPALRRILWAVLREASAVDDGLQTTFLKFFEHRPDFRSTDEANACRAWLVRVAANEALLLKRKQRVQQRHLAGVAWLRSMRQADDSDRDHAGNSRGSGTGNPLQRVIAAERNEQVRNLLASLPEDQRVIVQLRIYDNQKFAEIAQRLGLPLGTVLSRMRAAVGRLKLGLEKLG